MGNKKQTGSTACWVLEEKLRLGAASHRETDGMRLGYDESGLGSVRCARMQTQTQTQVSWDYWRSDLHARCMDNLGPEYSGAVVGVASDSADQGGRKSVSACRWVGAAARNAEKGCGEAAYRRDGGANVGRGVRL
jgi:hypothetical protein